MQTTQTTKVLIIEQWIDGVGIEKFAVTNETANKLLAIADETRETAIWGRLVEVDNAQFDEYNEFQAMANYGITDHALEGRFNKVLEKIEEIEAPNKAQLTETINLLK